MVVTPNPDPTSRFPTSYCKKCGGGWPEYMRCDLWERSNHSIPHRSCDFSGEVPMTDEMKTIAELFAKGEVPAGTRKLYGKSEWGAPKTKVTDNDGWGVPMSNDGWGVPTKGK